MQYGVTFRDMATMRNNQMRAISVCITSDTCPCFVLRTFKILLTSSFAMFIRLLSTVAFLPCNGILGAGPLFHRAHLSPSLPPPNPSPTLVNSTLVSVSSRQIWLQRASESMQCLSFHVWLTHLTLHSFLGRTDILAGMCHNLVTPSSTDGHFHPVAVMDNVYISTCGPFSV